MLGYYYLCPSDVIRIFGKTLIVISVDEDYHIRILLDGTGFTEVAELRPAIASLTVLGLTRELRKGDDRNIHLLRCSLKCTRDGRNLLLSHTAKLRRALHQLKVVHHDKAHTLLLDKLLHL